MTGNGFRWAAALAVVVLGGVTSGCDLPWSDDDSDSASTTAATEPAPEKVLKTTDADGLAKLASGSGSTVYWAGPDQEADKFEWTQLPDGKVYVRYLTGDAKAGDPNADYLTVSTYPVGDGVDAVKTAAKEPGGTLFEAPDGATATVNESTSTSVYVAFPDSEYEVEVFDPDPAVALQLVKDGAIQPIE